MTYFADTNVLLAFLVEDSPQHERVVSWLAELATDRVVICRVVQMSVLRLLTNAAVMGGSLLTPAEAWSRVDRLCADLDLEIAGEPAGMDVAWRTLTQGRTRGHNFWTDSYLAAFALRHRFTIVTFDRGFRHYAEVSSVIL